MVNSGVMQYSTNLPHANDTHERLDFPFCKVRIARLCNMDGAEIGKS